MRDKRTLLYAFKGANVALCGATMPKESDGIALWWLLCAPYDLQKNPGHPKKIDFGQKKKKKIRKKK